MAGFHPTDMALPRDATSPGKEKSVLRGQQTQCTSRPGDQRWTSLDGTIELSVTQVGNPECYRDQQSGRVVLDTCTGRGGVQGELWR